MHGSDIIPARPMKEIQRPAAPKKSEVGQGTGRRCIAGAEVSIVPLYKYSYNLKLHFKATSASESVCDWNGNDLIKDHV